VEEGGGNEASGKGRGSKGREGKFLVEVEAVGAGGSGPPGGCRIPGKFLFFVLFFAILILNK
jgi:hypothetical protein